MLSSHASGAPGGLDDPGQLLDVPDGDAGVGLAGRDEAVLDAHVDLGEPARNQAPPRARRRSGLVDLGHAEDADVEAAHGVLTARRAGHLDVVQEHLHARQSILTSR